MPANDTSGYWWDDGRINWRDGSIVHHVAPTFTNTGVATFCIGTDIGTPASDPMSDISVIQWPHKYERKKGMHIVQFRHIEEPTLTEMIASLAVAELTARKHEDLGLDVPAGMQDNIEELELSIEVAIRAERKRKLVRLKSQREALESRGEKRRRLDDEIAQLES